MSLSKRKLLIFSQTVFLFGSSVVSAFAQETVPLEDKQKYVVDGVLTIQGIEGMVANVFAIAITGIGFAGFVMMIVGSFQYLMSGGDSKGVEGGKNTLTYAVVGLIVALSSFVILNFIAAFTGVETIKIFNLCFDGNC